MDGVLGRTVVSRDRFARVWGLGDRNQPTGRTPGLVMLDGDPSMEVALAPFKAETTRTLPATLTLTARGAFEVPSFDTPGPTWSVGLGHVLPPEMEEADAGEPAGAGPLLPVSWQRMMHDADLMDSTLAPQVVVLTDALALTSNPRRFIDAIVAIKRRFPGALLWAPGIGGPDNLALLVWLGVDLFDLTRSRQAAASEMVLDRGGPRTPSVELGESASLDVQVDAWRAAVAEVREHLAAGTLRQLVDRQALVAPSTVVQLRHHDDVCATMEGLLERHVPRERKLMCMAETSLYEPAVLDWVNWMSAAYRAPQGMDRVLVLLPCSARKPYRFSKSHRRFIEAIGTNAVHEVMVTSPLGLVPRDLEQVWPAQHYDLAVTGRWSADELNRIGSMLSALIEAHDYQCIVDHSGLTLPESCYGGLPRIDTRQGESAGSRTALERLSEAVREAIRTHGARRRSRDAMHLDEWRSASRRLLGGDAWLDGTEVRGRPPRFRIMCGSDQIGQWSPDRGGFSLSKAAVLRLEAGAALPQVHLTPDVVWKGDIHVGIVQDVVGDVRVGSDLLVMQNGQAIGLARALAPGWEWAGTPGRLAKAHQRL
ncbi:MAG: DUF5591 domain-containing protein [Candidatus Poseidoniaceae archaeon]